MRVADGISVHVSVECEVEQGSMEFEEKPVVKCKARLLLRPFMTPSHIRERKYCKTVQE